MRAGPQLGVDAYGVRRYGSVIQVCEQPCATLTLQAFAKTIILGRRFYFPRFKKSNSYLLMEFYMSNKNQLGKKLHIGVLAVQGAFIEHERILESLGAEVFEIRQLRDLDRPIDGLVLPGGESTVQGKLLRDLGLFEPLRKKIVEGLPVLATCAGAILRAEHIAGEDKAHFATLPAVIRRNA